MIDTQTLLTTFVERVGEAIANGKNADFLDGLSDMYNALERKNENVGVC